MNKNINCNTQLSVILFSDISDFTKLSSKSQSTAMKYLKEHESDVKHLLSKYKGELLKNLGDGLLLKFNSSRESVLFAIELQKKKKSYEIRISINQGDVIINKNDVIGDGVNIASRINKFSPVGGIVVSSKIKDDIITERDITLYRIGQYYLKGKNNPFELSIITNDGVNVNNKIIVSNFFIRKKVSTYLNNKGEIGIFETRLPSILLPIFVMLCKGLSMTVYYSFYYFVVAMFLKIIHVDNYILKFLEQYLSINSISFDNLCGLVGLIKGMTLGGVDINNRLNITFKINNYTRVRKYNNLWFWQVGTGFINTGKRYFEN
jgi:hypothetical protein